LQAFLGIGIGALCTTLPSPSEPMVVPFVLSSSLPDLGEYELLCLEPKSLLSSDGELTGLRKGIGSEAVESGGEFCCGVERSSETEVDDALAPENGQPLLDDDGRRPGVVDSL
jgi:hypothetical protein